ncbi:hypothetical protein RKD49_002039 [Streptomyces glaucescens]
MGIRMLSLRRTATPLRPVPAFSAGASTARVAGPATVLRHTATDLRRRIGRRAPSAVRPRDATGARRLRADLVRGYLALFLALVSRLPSRPRPTYTVTVFTATIPALSEPPKGSGAGPRRPCPYRPAPGPGATP